VNSNQAQSSKVKAQSSKLKAQSSKLKAKKIIALAVSMTFCNYSPKKLKKK